MRKHGIRLLLYDYLEGTLSADDRRSVEQHLAGCVWCARDLEELRESLSLLAPARAAHRRVAQEPAWERMVESILRVTAAVDRHHRAQHHSPAVSLALWWNAYYSHTAVAAALVLVTMLLFVSFPRGPRESVPARHADAEQMADSIVNERVTRYLRTSRALLTELANAPSRGSGDMTAERSTSRQLIAEARYLRRQPLDEYSAGVITDVERIMLKMANLPDRDPEGDLRLIQHGLDHRNLLFRVRMAEQAYQTRSIVRVAAARQGDIP
jgi:anti-sigma-K factor RskA